MSPPTTRSRYAARCAGEVGRHRLPLAQVGLDQPVDELVDAALDVGRRVGHHVPLEALLDARLVDQVEDAPEAHHLVEVGLPAALHLEQDVVDGGHPRREVARQVALVLRQLALDVVERREVAGEQVQPLVDDARRLVHDVARHAERVEQLEPQRAPRRPGVP